MRNKFHPISYEAEKLQAHGKLGEQIMLLKSEVNNILACFLGQNITSDIFSWSLLTAAYQRSNRQKAIKTNNPDD